MSLAPLHTLYMIAYTTADVNFITAHGTHSMFPYLTFRRHKMAMLKPLNDAFGEYLWDLNEHDWQITDVIYPSKFEDNRAGLGPLKESWGPPGLGEDLRIAGDEQSWVIKLNTQGVHAPDEDYLIESQEFDFDDMPYGEPPRRDIDFYRVQMDVYEHPLLCHRYALCNEEWSEFLDRRLDRLFALKLAKTKRAARPKDIFQAATFVSADSTDGEYLKIDPQQFEWWRRSFLAPHHWKHVDETLPERKKNWSNNADRENAKYA